MAMDHALGHRKKDTGDIRLTNVHKRRNGPYRRQMLAQRISIPSSVQLTYQARAP